MKLLKNIFHYQYNTCTNQLNLLTYGFYYLLSLNISECFNSNFLFIAKLTSFFLFSSIFSIEAAELEMLTILNEFTELTSLLSFERFVII